MMQNDITMVSLTGRFTISEAFSNHSNICWIQIVIVPHGCLYYVKQPLWVLQSSTCISLRKGSSANAVHLDPLVAQQK